MGRTLMFRTGSSLSLKEDEENRQHKATEGGQMVPVQGLALEKNGNNQSEDYQGHDLLDDLKLDKAERAAVSRETDTVRRNLGAIFEKSETPGKKNHEYERPGGGNLHFLKLEMAIPGECHEYVGEYQQYYCEKSFHAWNQKKG